jgi:hypothetical protein
MTHCCYCNSLLHDFGMLLSAFNWLAEDMHSMAGPLMLLSCPTQTLQDMPISPLLSSVLFLELRSERTDTGLFLLHCFIWLASPPPTHPVCPCRSMFHSDLHYPPAGRQLAHTQQQQQQSQRRHHPSISITSSWQQQAGPVQGQVTLSCHRCNCCCC